MIVMAILVTSNGNTSVKSAESPTRDSNNMPVTSMIQSGLAPLQDQEMPMEYIMNLDSGGIPMVALALLEPPPIQDWNGSNILVGSIELDGVIPLDISTDILTPPRQSGRLSVMPEPPTCTPEPPPVLILALGTLGMIPVLKRARRK